MSWIPEYRNRLGHLGHRNWVLVADAAYPEQVSPGIHTVVTGEPLMSVLPGVLKAMEITPHVRPVAVLDAELAALPEEMCPGVDAFRAQLSRALHDVPVERRPHAEILETLSEVAKTYSVLVLKTTSTIPYTSVFLRLECGYWTEEQEQVLREQMEAER